MKKVFLMKYNGVITAVCTSKMAAIETSLEFLLEKDFIKSEEIAAAREDFKKSNNWVKNGYIVLISEAPTNKNLSNG